LEAIGGLENLKEWIVARKCCFTKEAKEYGLPNPKGLLMVGVPGVGKSLAAKCIGTAFGVPTIRLEIGNLLNSLVGESEKNCRKALQLCEAIAPCILHADEIEKGLAGSKESHSGDSGVTKRIFGQILKWMQDKSAPVFLVATVNNVSALPPEFLRKGRFDEIFMLDLPNIEERKEIFKIHIAKRKRNPEKFNIKILAENTDNFTGAEIEASIEAAMFTAFNEKREFNWEDIIKEITKIYPLAKVAKEDIDILREWGETKARKASKIPKFTGMRKIK
jgi:SpoVK/Ycf46/Vps4 family AAA+-type ATPase